ncbi:CheR family methyltransferase [Flavobacterium sp.]|uniref:CheR family methyltransferase n=1 Tax=Flavobacterium sp. TaxID=239 RepID=UPI0025F9EDAD|nr:CheR family methyltransferase [Flavobacterium sp.]
MDIKLKTISKKKKAEIIKKEIYFPVVGIGAAAGGLEPLIKILHHIPPDSGIAYLIIRHFLPEYDNTLIEKLQQSTLIPVQEIINEIHLLPNQVYVVPENHSVINVNGVLKLEKIIHLARQKDCIDISFTSLAEVCQSFAIGMLLSGAGFDGVHGLKMIREKGGVTLVQDPESATYMGKPHAAIESDIVDFILLPEETPLKIIRIYEAYKTNFGYSDKELMPQSLETVLEKIIGLVSTRSGNDFTDYKRPMLRRRIARRMVVLTKETLLDYYNLLRIDKAEQDSLFNDFLIPVTFFFRDKSLFDTLSTEVFPKLIQNADNNTLRIWVAGCSTGEEAYSLAIGVTEYLSEKKITNMKVQVFASDISEINIMAARVAIYSATDIQHVSEEWIKRYFIKRDGYFHIDKKIRDMCVFAVHNFHSSPPFAKMNLISCRNVFTYLNTNLQNKVLGAFHYSLQENGFLLLGASETADESNLFEPLGKYAAMYVRKHSDERFVPEAFESTHAGPRVKMKEFIKRVAAEQEVAFEELRVFNEELEKSAEELQSSNEELSCVNEELLNRNEQLLGLRCYSESITRTIRQPLVIIDRNFTIKYANPAFYTHFKTTENKTENYSFFEVGNCQWNIREFKEIIEKLKTTNELNDFKVVTLCPEIGKKTMMVNARQIVDSKPNGMILIAFEDITEIVAMNELLIGKNEELNIQNEQLQAFSSSASHDLQEPLRKIHMFCTRIVQEEKNLSESSKFSLDRIMTSIVVMRQLITDLIGFTKANIITQKDYKKTDLNQLLRRTTTDIKDIIAEKKAEIVISTLPALHVIPHQIQQLFTNLIINSIKYTAKDVVPHIKIDTVRPSQEEVDRVGGDSALDYVKLKISDNGIGFSPKYATRIFEPFYRLHSKDKYRGSGLGLTLSKKIVVNHNGVIQAESQENIGTVISIYLPVA